MTINSLELRCSFQRAMLFNITDSMRFIFADVEDEILIVRCIFSKNPDEDEIDSLISISEEVYGDFKELRNTEVIWETSSVMFKDLAKTDFIVFARKESII